MAVPMSNKGFTLLEVVATIALISLLTLATVPTIYNEYHYTEVGHAVDRAREIATSLQYARSLDVISNFNASPGTLRDFLGVSGNSSSVNNYIPSLGKDTEWLGVNQKDLYTVRVTDYSVQVSFSRVGDAYRGMNFPSSRSVETPLPQGAGVYHYRTTWTVGPTPANSIASHYQLTHYINGEK